MKPVHRGFSLLLMSFFAVFLVTACGYLSPNKRLVKDAIEDYEAARFTESLKKFNQAAESDNPDAYFYLGRHYYFGQGVVQDYVLSRRYYESAVALGNPKAMNNLGTMLKGGLGGSKDTKRAYDLFLRAHQEGVPHATFNLGDMAYRQRDFESARRYYKAAGDAGLSSAKLEFARMAFKGEGGPKNIQEAILYFSLASEQGESSASSVMGGIYRVGLDDQGVYIQQDSTQAYEWYLKAADQGINSEAYYQLGEAFREGDGVAKNYQAALSWYRKAEAYGSPKAMLGISLLYYFGQGVDKRPDLAAQYMKRSAELGLPVSQYNLGRFYLFGDGVTKDLQQAKIWCKRAMQNGYTEANGCLTSADQQLAKLRQERTHAYSSTNRYRSNASPTVGKDDTWSFGEILAAGAAILVGAAVLDSVMDDSTTDSSSVGVGGACRKKAINQIATCEIRTTDCHVSGCNQEMVCGKSKSGGSGYVCTGFWERVVDGGSGAKSFYCDTENPKNRSENLDEVIAKVCDQR